MDMSPSRPDLTTCMWVVEPADKNFDGLLAALVQVVSIEPGVALCVVGKPFSNGELKRIAQLGLKGHVEHYGYANDDHLAKLDPL